MCKCVVAPFSDCMTFIFPLNILLKRRALVQDKDILGGGVQPHGLPQLYHKAAGPLPEERMLHLPPGLAKGVVIMLYYGNFSKPKTVLWIHNYLCRIRIRLHN